MGTDTISKTSDVIAGEIVVAWVTNRFPSWPIHSGAPVDKAGLDDGTVVGDFYKKVYKAIREAYNE